MKLGGSLADIETRTCPHGCSLGVSHLPGGVWAAPVSRCRCCLGDFGYIDRAMFGQHRVVTDTWTPKDLCGQCGGKVVHYDSRGGPAPQESAQ